MKKSLFLAALAASTLAAFGDIYMAGDSTMTNQSRSKTPITGWGQALAEFMKDPAQLHNKARSGRSARSFKDEGSWQGLVNELKPGDFVIMAFGHNDGNSKKPQCYSTPEDFKAIMLGFANDVKAKGATPVFATSIVHAAGLNEKDGKFTVNGQRGGIGAYVAATRELASETGIALLDINQYAIDNLPKEMTCAEAKKLYMIIEPGEYDRWPEGHGDGCHPRDTGAFWFAKAAVTMAFDQKLPIAAYFKDPATVRHARIGKDGNPVVE